jgi:tetratricopeptide (TPR) repeat protein
MTCIRIAILAVIVPASLACGPGLERCPATSTVNGWIERPDEPLTAQQWQECAASFAGCTRGEPAGAALARIEFCRAMALRAQGDTAAAVEALEAAAMADPDWAPPLAVLGLVALSEGHAGQAVMHLEKAVVLDPGWAAPLSDLGLALMQLEDLEGALARFEAALALDPLMASAHANRAGILAGLGRHNEAIAGYITAIELEPGEPLHYFNLAGLFEDLGEHHKAAAAYGSLLDLLPEDRHPAVHLKIGLMLQAAGMVEEAEALFLTTLEEAPTSLAALDALASLYLETDRHEEAWDVFRRMAALDPGGTARHMFALGNVFAAGGELGLAARCFGLAVEIHPDTVETYINLGAVMIQLGSLEEAVDVLTRALEISPEDADVLHNLGIAHERLYELDLAEQMLRAALDVDVQRASTYSHLGQVLRLAGRLEDSLVEHDKAVGLSPDDPDIRARRAWTLVELGRTEDATVDLERSLKVDPDNATALLVTAISLLDTKKTLGAAVTMLRDLVDSEPLHAEAHAWLALALSRTKSKKDALDQLEQALDLDPHLGKQPWIAKLLKKIAK